MHVFFLNQLHIITAENLLMGQAILKGYILHYLDSSKGYAFQEKDAIDLVNAEVSAAPAVLQWPTKWNDQGGCPASVLGTAL